MSAGVSGARARTKRVFALGLACALLCGGWLLSEGTREEPVSDAPATDESAGLARSAEPRSAEPRSAEPPAGGAEHEARPLEGERAAAEQPELPHPITADHLRLYREVDLLEGAADALRAHDPDQARKLLASYEHEQALPKSRDHEGLSLLADCVEQRTERAIERVQAFYDTHTSSLVRRQLRTQCLQAPIAAR